jgi:hypothetical protein
VVSSSIKSWLVAPAEMRFNNEYARLQTTGKGGMEEREKINRFISTIKLDY